jgi:type III restriction enzyme
LENPIKEVIRNIQERIEDFKSTISDFFVSLKRIKTIETRIRAIASESVSKTAQIEALKAQLTNISSEDQKILNTHQSYLSEAQTVSRLEEDVNEISNILQETLSKVGSLPRDLSVTIDSPQGPIIGDMIVKLVSAQQVAYGKITQAQHVVLEAIKSFKEDERQWKIGYDDYLNAFRQAKKRANIHRQQLDQIEKLSIEIQILNKQIEDLNKEKDEINFDPSKELENQKGWIALHQQRGDLLEEACSKLTSQSNGDIRADLKRGADIGDAFKKLKETLQGTGSRQDWMDILKQCVSSSDNPACKWTQILMEFRLLAEVPSEQSQDIEIPSCPILKEAHFSDPVLRQIMNKLDADNWLQLLLISLNDKPEFYFRLNDQTEIPFEFASPGQQATAILTVLLNQEGGILLIDQPEDDLDNAIINRIVENIWSAKERRQLIFTSHNANLVVNGDAELVLHCNYYKDESRSAGHIECSGAIEEAEICKAIKTVMEGGEKAFELRKAKYGF